ncbi:flagellin [Brevibacillus agri]|uniref:flagellin N-terminal helical domain-containing protein n=1 Tax=Brevibacillus agri TaxID=51101 RepID=UPI00046F8C0F|nr:flagellin [Brevibacillus agri]
MIISHNLAALNTNNRLRNNNRLLTNSLEKLSSGLRINKAADDAAGLTISEKMRAQIRGLEQAKRNIQDGISLIQTAEGALGSIHDILQRMNELAVQAANGTYTDDDRKRVQDEFEELKKEIDNIAKNTEFNGVKLLDGSISGKIRITGSYIGVWGFGQNPTQGERWGVGSFPYHSTFEFSSGSSVWIPTEIKSNINETLLELKKNFYKVKNNEIIYGTANTLIQNHNMEMYVYGNTVIVTSASDFTLTGDSYLIDAKYLTGNPATYDISIEDTLIKIQTGPNSGQFNSIAINDAQTAALKIDDISLSSQKNVQDSLRKIEQAINYISTERSKLGAYQNRLEYAMNNVANYAENLTAAESRIRDIDMAKEMMVMIKQNILMQSSQAMLAQANQLPNGVLNLLK